MKTVSISELRRNWRRVEAALRFECEILVTRKGIPTARLIHIPPEQPKRRRRRWNMEAHARWQKRVNRGVGSSSDALLAELRADRKF